LLFPVIAHDDRAAAGMAGSTADLLVGDLAMLGLIGGEEVIQRPQRQS
jgi:hypothetical protein